MNSFSYVILILVFFVQLHFSYGLENEVQNDNKELVKVLENYWQWWSNSPEDNPDNEPSCSININTNYSFVYLQNPFETGDTTYDCIENPIPKGYFIFFPLITSFCSQGDVGLSGASYEQIRNCALNLDRGIIKGTVIIDGKEVVDVSIDNGNGISMNNNKNIINNLPESSSYYQEIFSQEFINILATNKTIHENNWENDEYKTHPVYYNGVVHCDCIIIDTSGWNTGSHTLEYTVSAKAAPPSPNLIADKWDFTSTTNYKLVIQ